jgi:hypothetical protein
MKVYCLIFNPAYDRPTVHVFADKQTAEDKYAEAIRVSSPDEDWVLHEEEVDYTKVESMK